MNRYAMAALCLMVSAGAQADRIRPDVEVNVPPEVFMLYGDNACCSVNPAPENGIFAWLSRSIVSISPASK